MKSNKMTAELWQTSWSENICVYKFNTEQNNAAKIIEYLKEI
jgi:hypothetical protein